MAEDDKPANDDYDSPWKEAMVVYLRDFFDFFFPCIAEDIDWGKPPVFLDTKLRQMEREANLGKSTNPFAHLVAATLYAQTTGPHSKERESKKYHLVRNLYDLGLSKEQIRHFFKLIDWVLTLSSTTQQNIPSQNTKVRRGEQNAVHYRHGAAWM